jgi:hypothetical protein
MERVFSIDDMPWTDLKGLAGARGFEFKALTNDAYTKAYSCELVRLEPGDHSVPHIGAPFARYARARSTRSAISVRTTCSFWQSTTRHASEKRIKNTQPGREDRAGRRV